MVQFGYLRLLILDIETVSCRLFQEMSRQTWTETWKSWVMYSSFNAMPAKITKKFVIVSALWQNLVDIIFILQEHFLYG